MQTVICALIVVIAILYVANRWLPTNMKHRLMPWLSNNATLQHEFSGKQAGPTGQSGGSCGSCSSCGNCGSASTKMMKK